MHFPPDTGSRAPLLCGCLVDLMPADVPRYLRSPEVGMLEWRLDLSCRKAGVTMVESGLQLLGRSPRHPVLATNRPVREGGAYEGTESKRLEILRKALDSGAEWVDLEHDSSEETVRAFRVAGARVLLSHHDFTATPDASALRRLAERLALKGPDAIKIVTHAVHPEDNLRVLSLIPFIQHELGRDALAFCMGPVGRWSRPVSLILGSPWTYVQLTALSAAAPGQFSAREMREALAALHGSPVDDPASSVGEKGPC